MVNIKYHFILKVLDCKLIMPVHLRDDNICHLSKTFTDSVLFPFIQEVLLVFSITPRSCERRTTELRLITTAVCISPEQNYYSSASNICSQ